METLTKHNESLNNEIVEIDTYTHNCGLKCVI